jgi:hypothetical protein
MLAACRFMRDKVKICREIEGLGSVAYATDDVWCVFYFSFQEIAAVMATPGKFSGRVPTLYSWRLVRCQP